MEERGLKISRMKTQYLGCNEHQDAVIQLQGETTRVKTFTYLGSTLAKDGELDEEMSPTECRAGGRTGRVCLECCAIRE